MKLGICISFIESSEARCFHLF